MRILRLDLGDGIGTVDLHPFISVLHDLDALQANTLVSAVRGLVNGSGSRVRGLIENDGHLVELGELTGQSIGPLTTEDVVVEVDRIGSGQIRPDVALAELDQLRRRAEIDAVLVEEIRADLEPSIAAWVYQLQQQLEDANGGRSSMMKAKMARASECVAAVEREPVSFTEVPEPIRDLIGGWESYSRARADASEHLDGLGRRVQQAESTLAHAMQQLAEAQQKAKPILLSAIEDSRLEELVHPSDRKRRAKGLTDAEEAELAELLQKVGMPSYTAHALHRLSPTPPTDQLVLLDQAKQRLAEAHSEAEAARAALESDSTAAALEFQFDDVKAEARRHLGPMLPSDLGAALSELVIQVENPAWLDNLRTLYERMLQEGIDVPEDIEPERLTSFASQWIAEMNAQLANHEVVDPAVVAADLALAERDFARHARAMIRIDQLEAQAVASAARVAELEASTAVGHRGGAACPVIETLTELGNRLRGQNSRSVSIVLTGEFEAVPDAEIEFLMGQLEGLAQQHQLILATSRTEITAWAASVGLRRALRSTPSRVAEGQ
ncbi:MAG: hypothetical protein O3C27_10820 [Actinomycetota bacterium]|nr:hypothetical protein [Actinomycetota bacterium]